MMLNLREELASGWHLLIRMFFFPLVDQRWKSRIGRSSGQHHLFEHVFFLYTFIIIYSFFSSHAVSNQVCLAQEASCTMTAVRNPIQM